MEALLAYTIAIIAMITTSALGSVFTYKSTRSPWYQCIKPSITPPSIVFPIVWSILYILLAIAFGRLLLEGNPWVISLFVINLILNVTWCLFYFALKMPVVALTQIIGIIGVVIAILIVSGDKVAKYLIIPYLLWICFATVLNSLSIPKVKGCASIRN